MLEILFSHLKIIVIGLFLQYGRRENPLIYLCNAFNKFENHSEKKKFSQNFKTLLKQLFVRLSTKKAKKQNIQTLT